MNEQDITRATVETVAENIVDGIISPLFYFFIGGLPLAVLYRMSNTMDAMIGYKMINTFISAEQLPALMMF